MTVAAMTGAAQLIATIIGTAGIGAAGLILLAGMLAVLDRRFAAIRLGVAPPPWRQPWIDLVALSRKRRLRPALASPWYPAWPVIALAATGSACLLVPGFADATPIGSLATAPMLAGLLGLAVAARLAASLESGDGLRGLAAALAARRLLIGGAVWLSVFAVMAVRAGSVTLDVLAGLAALLTLPCFSLASPDDYAGPERALFMIEAMLRRVVMLAVVIGRTHLVALAVSSQPATWPLGLVCWGAAMLAMGSAVLWCAPRRFATCLGVVCAGSAVIGLIIQTVPGATILLAAGAIAGLAGLIRLATPGDPAEVAGLVQIGLALAGFGCGADQASWLILAVVVLARLAGLLARSGWVAMLALAAMAGLPPFGGFAGDFAVVRAGFAQNRWLGAVMLGVWGLMAVLALRRSQPAGTAPWRRMVPGLAALAVSIVLGVMPWLLTAIL